MIGSPELRVIQATLRVDDGCGAAVTAALRCPLEWDCLQRLALHHGVLPLVHKGLMETVPDLVPPAALRAMKIFLATNERRVLLMTADLIRVVHALEAAGISVLCVKGPALATLMHGDPAARLFWDLDILVRQRDCPSAEQALQALGLEPIINECFAARDTSNEEYRQRNERHFFFAHRRYQVELHWRLAEKLPRALDAAALFERRRQVTVHGQALTTLALTDTALHLGYHGTHHGWTKFSYLVDLVSILRILEPRQWVEVLQAAGEQGLHRPLLIGMRLCEQLLGMNLPTQARRKMQWNLTVKWTAHPVCTFLARDSAAGKDLFDELLFDALVMEEGRLRKLRLLLSSMFTPTANDYQWVRLPGGLCWLYPVLRPFRRLGRGMALLRSHAGRGKTKVMTNDK